MREKPLVSVIIPIVKNDPFIKKNLEHLEKSTYKNLEIIVVDEGKERSYQRNFGIKKAKGKYLLYLDADQYVTPKLIEELVDLANIGFSAIYIPEQIITKGFFAYLRNWERQFYNGTPVDCVRFMAKENCPLFSEDLNGPEDSDHDRQVKGIRTTSRNYLLHDDGISFIKFLRKKAYYSKSMKNFAQKNPGDKVLNLWWRCIDVYFENSKWKRVLQRPDLFICLMGLIFLRGVIYFAKR